MGLKNGCNLIWSVINTAGSVRLGLIGIEPGARSRDLGIETRAWLLVVGSDST